MPDPLSFDNSPALYDRFRPRYTPELFSAVLKYSGAGEGARALEVGCGTGQATEPFLKVGLLVDALEPGVKLVSFTEDKFRNYKNIKIINEKFEDYFCPLNSYDLIYSATAFHWVDQNTGLKKALDVLKPGGTLALFWNHPFMHREDNPVHAAIQQVYDAYRDRLGWKPLEVVEHDQTRYDSILSGISAAGFTAVELRLFKTTRTLDSADYISLLHTYSDHIAIKSPLREEFMAAIKAAIDSQGGKIEIYDTIDLYLGRKP